MIEQTDARGFVALVSVVIISAMIAILVFTLGAVSFLVRFDEIDAASKEQSEHLAANCVREALVRIAQDPDYAPEAAGDCISAGNTCSEGPYACRICAVSVGFPKHIIARAVFRHAYTTYRVTIEDTLAITRWQEIVPAEKGACVIP